MTPSPHPSRHSVGSVVAATRQPMPPLDHADSAFTSRAPLLAPLEPALLLQSSPFCAAGAAIGNRNVLHAQSVRAFFVGVRVITGIRCLRQYFAWPQLENKALRRFSLPILIARTCGTAY